MTEGKWYLVGQVPVDTGTIVLADPAYLIPEAEWDEWCENKLFKMKAPAGAGMLPVKRGHMKTTVASSTGMGDGIYPVEVRVVDGSVAELRIRFLEDDGRVPGMPTEAEAQAARDRDRQRVLAADRSNVKKYAGEGKRRTKKN